MKTAAQRRPPIQTPNTLVVVFNAERFRLCQELEQNCVCLNRTERNEGADRKKNEYRERTDGLPDTMSYSLSFSPTLSMCVCVSLLPHKDWLHQRSTERSSHDKGLWGDQALLFWPQPSRYMLCLNVLDNNNSIKHVLLTYKCFLTSQSKSQQASENVNHFWKPNFAHFHVIRVPSDRSGRLDSPLPPHHPQEHPGRPLEPAHLHQNPGGESAEICGRSVHIHMHRQSTDLLCIQVQSCLLLCFSCLSVDGKNQLLLALLKCTGRLTSHLYLVQVDAEIR